MSLFEIPQLFTHSKNSNLGSTPSSFQFQSSTCDEMQHDNDNLSHETQEPLGYFFMNYTQLYLIIPNYTHFYCTQLYTIVQIYIYNNLNNNVLILYNIFTNVECEPSPIIELNDTIPSSDNSASSTNTTDLIDWCERILEEGYQKLTKLNNPLRRPQNDMCTIQTCKFSPYIFPFPLTFSSYV